MDDTQPRRILLIGHSGQIGWELQRSLATLGEVVVPGADGQHRALDLARPETLRALIRQIHPAVIVNAAAYTRVDDAEREESLARTVNGIAPGVLAEESARLGAWLVHYSTDYVFDGGKATPYREDDAPRPLNVYGETKLAGEQAIQSVGGRHLILRTSWVYGLRGRNFLLTLLRLARQGRELPVVDDQIGAPTWSRVVAESTAQILVQCLSPLTRDAAAEDLGGLYHLSCAGHTSWHGFARVILEQAARGDPANPAYASLDARLEAIDSSRYPGAARRPANSQLDNGRLARTFGLVCPPWDQALALCLAEARPQPDDAGR